MEKFCPVVSLLLIFLSYFFAYQALEDGKLNLSTAVLVMKQVKTHKSPIVAYISSARQRQEFQYGEGRVCIF